MNFTSIKTQEDQFQLATYKKMDIAVERGSGSYVWTADGTKYLDLYGGHAVAGTGHCHPHVADAISRQAEKMLFYSNLVYSPLRAAAAEKLVSVAPDGLEQVFFCNSGTEANENAMRIARLATGRSKVVSFAGGFHGRTADAISATFLSNYRDIGRPNVPGHVVAEFGDIDSVAKVIDDDTAAVLIEPIQSMAGMREASPEFFLELRKLCDKTGVKLIFDEVQTGVGRTGNWFFAESEAAGGVVPDIITLAKSLGSGIPVGACLVHADLGSQISVNQLGTTFGGGMIAMAAVLATLEAIEDDGMIANAKAVESAIRGGAKTVAAVEDVHGKGCLIGLRLSKPAADENEHLFANGIIAGTSADPYVLRLLPPLNLESDAISRFFQVISQ